jgi:hypothetical protein
VLAQPCIFQLRSPITGAGGLTQQFMANAPVTGIAAITAQHLPQAACATTTPWRAGCFSRRPAKCLTWGLSPRRGLSSNHKATFREKRLGEASMPRGWRGVYCELHE